MLEWSRFFRIRTEPAAELRLIVNESHASAMPGKPKKAITS